MSVAIVEILIELDTLAVGEEEVYVDTGTCLLLTHRNTLVGYKRSDLSSVRTLTKHGFTRF